MPLSSDSREFIALLNSHGVEYLIVRWHSCNAWSNAARRALTISTLGAFFSVMLFVSSGYSCGRFAAYGR